LNEESGEIFVALSLSFYLFYPQGFLRLTKSKRILIFVTFQEPLFKHG